MPKNADQILKIVLPKKPDKLLWGFDKNGNYQPVALGIKVLNCLRSSKRSHSNGVQSRNLIYWRN